MCVFRGLNKDLHMSDHPAVFVVQRSDIQPDRDIGGVISAVIFVVSVCADHMSRMQPVRVIGQEKQHVHELLNILVIYPAGNRIIDCVIEGGKVQPCISVNPSAGDAKMKQPVLPGNRGLPLVDKKKTGIYGGQIGVCAQGVSNALHCPLQQPPVVYVSLKRVLHSLVAGCHLGLYGILEGSRHAGCSCASWPCACSRCRISAGSIENVSVRPCSHRRIPAGIPGAQFKVRCRSSHLLVSAGDICACLRLLPLNTPAPHCIPRCLLPELGIKTAHAGITLH